MIASERWTRRVCCFNFLLVRLWHHQFTTIDEYYCAFAYAGGRMIPSAPALPPPPVRYLESLAVSCHVCSGRRLHPALLPEFQVSAGRSRQPSSWGDLETCPPVPVLKKKNNPTKSSIKSQPAASASVLLYPTAASSNFVFLSARQTVTDASVERAPQFGHGN